MNDWADIANPRLLGPTGSNSVTVNGEEWKQQRDLEPPLIHVPPQRPPWNGFDTFLRRTAMTGAVILLWGTIILGLLGASYVASVVHNIRQIDQVSTTDTGTPDPWFTDPTVVPGD
jgi:hypothetical protein